MSQYNFGPAKEQIGSATQSASGLMSSTDKTKLDSIVDMVGATASTAGTHGLVPAPASGDEDKVLKGNGTWGTVDALPAVTSSDNGKVLKVASGDWSVESEQDISGLAPKASPVFTGSISLNRESGITIGTNSFAVGTNVIATGEGDHSEGYYTTASGGYGSHSEGNNTLASGATAHAEGCYTTATGTYAHAQGYYTTANRRSQHTAGEYNVLDSSDVSTSERGNYVEIVGNGVGTSSRSNARTLDWSGNERIMGDIYVNCNSDSTGGTKLENAVAMTGATSGSAGAAGLVPAPSSGDQDKVLKGSGTWGTVDALPAVTSSDNDKVLEVSNGSWNIGSEKINKTFSDNEFTYFQNVGPSMFVTSNYIWTDGDNIYYSNDSVQYVLDKSTSTWTRKVWKGLTSFNGFYIWSDGDNIYCSFYNDVQYVLDKSTSTWNVKEWNGFSNILGSLIWKDGDNIYYSQYSYQYVLDKSTSTWNAKTWNGYSSIGGSMVWSDGDNIYYSSYSSQYVLERSTSTWSAKSWTGLSSIDGDLIWTDGNNIYYSVNADQYVLDKSTSTWSAKTWTGLTSFLGGDVWSDGNNIYISNGLNQYVLDVSTSAWTEKQWTGLMLFTGINIWTDGDNIYYSSGKTHLIFNKSTYTWSFKEFSGLTTFNGRYIWTDGDNIYYSNNSTQYILDKSTSTWNEKSWSGRISFNGDMIWTDGENIYYSSYSSQYILNKLTSTWSVKSWTGLSSFNGDKIWCDGDNIYYSYNTNQYVLDKQTSTWTAKVWSGLTSFDGAYVWTDGNNTYYSSSETHYVLNKATSTWTEKTWTGLSNFTGSNIWTDGEHIYHSYNDTYELTKEKLLIGSNGEWQDVPVNSFVMKGATSSSDGKIGLVPAPSAGENVFFLRGDGDWAEPPGGKLIVVDLDTVTNTSGSYTHSTSVTGITSDMKPIKIELGDPSAFLDTITVTTADGSITLSCSSVEGTSTVRVSLMFVASADALTSSEFDVLAGRIGTLGDLTTTAKTSVVAAVNEVNASLGDRFKTVSSGSLHDIRVSGLYYVTGGVTDKPTGNGGYYSVTAYNSDLLVGVFSNTDGNSYNVIYTSGTWYTNRIANYAHVGDLSSLTTTAKGSAVAAINEVDSDLGSLTTRVSNLEVVETIWTGSATSGTNLSLTKNYSNYKWLLVSYQTNSELMTMLIHVPHLDTGKWYTYSISLFSGSGQQTDFTYKATCGVKFHDNSKMDVTAAYNNANLQLKVTRVVGVRK